MAKLTGNFHKQVLVSWTIGNEDIFMCGHHAQLKGNCGSFWKNDTIKEVQEWTDTYAQHHTIDGEKGFFWGG